jgi:hypothetical protein
MKMADRVQVTESSKLTRFAGASTSGAAYLGEKLQFLLNRANRFSPEPYELNPDSYAREAIAYFTTSLDSNVGLRQAKSEVNDGAFWKMCRSIYEHSVGAEIGSPADDLAPRPLVF